LGNSFVSFHAHVKAELLELLKKYEIEYDERYLWD
jgi:hypothetical protein